MTGIFHLRVVAHRCLSVYFNKCLLIGACGHPCNDKCLLLPELNLWEVYPASRNVPQSLGPLAFHLLASKLTMSLEQASRKQGFKNTGYALKIGTLT